MADVLDHSLADLDRAEVRLATEILPHYGAVMEPVHVDPRDDLEQVDDQRGEQTVTLLQLLGYLREPNAGEVAIGHCVWSAAEIDVAWRDWQRDWLALAATDEPALSIATGETQLANSNRDSLRRDLKACASLEGEVTLACWPEPGVVSLSSRVARMRLRLFGLSEQPAESAMASHSERALSERAARITSGLGLTATDVINRLGDIAGLTSVVAQRLAGRFVILHGPDDGSYAADVEPLAVAPGHKVKALNLKNEAMADWNRFSLRLLQVRLWTLNYYRGEVDGHWGAMSARALDAYLRDYGVPQRDRLFGKVKGGYVVLDIGGVLEHFAREVDAPAAALERGEIDAMLSRDRVSSNDAFWSRLAEVHDHERSADVNSPPAGAYADDGFQVASSVNVRRKRYFGWRGIFASFGRFLRQAARSAAAFVRAVLDAIKRGLGYVRNIARYIVDSTRVVMRVAALAVTRLQCWLTGTPVVTGNAPESAAVATLWQRDFDTIHLVSRDSTPELRTRHVQVLDWMQRSMGIMLEIGTQLLGAILTLGNWLMFAWSALQTVRKIVEVARDPLLAELLADTAAS